MMPVLIIALITGCGPADREQGQNPATTLKEAYKDAFLIGCAIGPGVTSGRDTMTTRLVLEQFNAITPGNVMKPAFTHPRPDTFTFGAADQYVEFGEQNNMYIVGHTLVWHNQTPDWFFYNEDGSPVKKEVLIQTLRDHIMSVAGRYAGRVKGWDVVNEVIDNDGSYRPTTWVNGIGDGDELVKLAFRFASEAAPGTELYYNDFNAWRPTKRDGIARLVRMLQAEGIRIDGVGIQAHWGLNFPKNEYIEAAIDTFASLGVKVMITELDVDVLPLTKEGQIIGRDMMNPQFQLEEFETFLDPYKEGLPEEVEQQLTDRYRELFEIFYKKRDKIDRVTFWGVHDGTSWKNGYPIPRRTNYPLLFDREGHGKPALDAVLVVPEMND